MSLEVNFQEDNKKDFNKKPLVVLLFVLFLVMLGSGFFIYQLVLAKSLGSEKALTKIGPIYETEEFVVNMSGSVNRYIKAQFALELSNKKVKKELEEKMPLLLDTVIMILSDQTVEVLKPQGKEILKNNLIEAINKFLDKGKIEKIYYLIFQLT
ncbi:MAG: flagellar basal body-associated FliL family protein [Clostridia bacterium]|nr:flagellar basal body-associated FliL family protein [Clostridia bacterium]